MKKLTEKERTLVEEYVRNGGHRRKAALKAYNTKSPKQASTIASRKLKEPKIQNAIIKELKKQGISLESSIAPIAKGLKAKKRDLTGRLILDENKKPIDDLDTQLKASDRALKLLLPKERPEANLSFSLNIDSAKFGGEFVKEGEIVDE